MDPRYQFFCPPGGAYYDIIAPESDAIYEVVVAEGWLHTLNQEWSMLLAPGEQLPEQGWKIHVTGTLDNAEYLLDRVARYCSQHRISFKHLRSPRALLFRNSKYSDRGSSGKFLTIFPADAGELESTVRALDDELAGEPGPYILSDLRWRDGPLYLRYGAFKYMTGAGPGGARVPCIRHPDGRLVPDVRGPSFRIPEWVTMPSFLDEALAARNSGTLADFPFRPYAALHFSNGGGVYRAVDQRDGRQVLLKEARPMAGLDESGADAVARLEVERWAMETLAGIPTIPRLLDYRKGYEHYFMVREYVEGVTLSQAVRERNPLFSLEQDEDSFRTYTRWALGVLAQVDESLAAMHERGVVFGDLHPNNIMITPDDQVAFIDLETSSADTTGFVPRIGAPGFRAPAGFVGTAVDRYALAATRLSVFVPLTVVLPWHPGKVEQLLDEVMATFPLPGGFAEAVRAGLASGAPGGAEPPAGLRPSLLPHGELRRRIVRGVLGAATPERADRLFPGDIEQFTVDTGGVTFAHGAAGVLWGLHELGEPVLDVHVDWLVRALDRSTGLGLGFGAGVSGAAYALDRLGRTADAAGVLEHLRGALTFELGHSLVDGIPGVGLVLLDHYERHGDASLLELARELAAQLVTGMDGAEPEVRSARTGVWYGPTGAALFLLRLHAATADADLLEPAARALRRDLTTLGWDGGPEDRRLWREHTSFATGSAGIAMVLHDARSVLTEPWVERATADLVGASERQFLENAGLFHGRAGALMLLVHVGRTPDDPAVRSQLRGLDLCAVGDDDKLSFLGHTLLRLSTDLATGSVGVALALEAVVGGAVRPPFFEARPSRGGVPEFQGAVRVSS